MLRIQYFDCLPVKISTLLHYSMRNVSVHHGTFVLPFCFFWASVLHFDCLPPQSDHLMSPCVEIPDQCITAHLVCFCWSCFMFLASVFQSVASQDKQRVASFSKSNDWCITAHVRLPFCCSIVHHRKASHGVAIQ